LACDVYTSLPKAFNTRGRSRDIFRGGDEGGDGRMRGPRSLMGGRSAEGGSKLKTEEIGLTANETVALLLGNRLT